MNRDYKKLELDKILKLLSEQAWSEHAVQKILETEPKLKTDEIKEEIKKTDDAFTLSVKYGTPRFIRVKNICSSVKRAGSGSLLSLRELLDAGQLLRQIGMLESWFSQFSQSEDGQNSLTAYFMDLQPNKNLLNSIDMAIISEEEISDNASPELSRIRKAISRQSASIREQLDKMVRNQNTQKFLQENIVTMRDGRYVVPVKIEYKNEVSGLVHDASSSGQTLFIEPMGVVEANNEIRLLKGKEQSEIERIIAELSAGVGDIEESIIYGYEAVIELEVYFAKANFGAKMKACVPVIDDKPCLELKNARHPLINADNVVPINLKLGEDYNCLIVTGPNTGGKTVAIKTAGLITLMAMCGLMIPASDGSRVGSFVKIFADIGDEQSIEQSLSTFSSHMNNIIEIMKTADENSLILLDELGSGTDPVEGAALAVSILEFLKDKGCRVIATTHYQEVKLFALETEGVENACCEFDINTLKPTYKLIIGIPGKSNAFEIVKKLGMNDEIIKKAGSLVSAENKRFEEVVENLEKSRQELEELKSGIAAEERKSRELKIELEKKLVQVEKDKERELQNARNKSLSIINEVRFSADLLIEELERLKREKDKAEFSEKVKNVRGKFNKSLDKMYDTANPVVEKKIDEYKLPRALKAYDTVLLADIDKKGTLIAAPDKSGNCQVQIGLIKTKTNIKNLRLIEETAEDRIKINNRPISTKGLESNMTRKTGMELDIRGMAADEGVTEVDRFIDSSIMGGLHIVTIIHGKGTGVLRNAVHQFLKKHKHVKSYRLGVYGEGEAGVTVVEIE